MPPTNEQDQPNNVWGSSSLGKSVFLTCPSGQTVQAKVIGLQGVMATGVMGEADSLTAFVGKHFVKAVREGGKPPTEEIDAARLMKSPDTLRKIVKMVDGLMPHVVVDPKVFCHYRVVNPGTDKEDTLMIPPAERVCHCGLREDHREHHDHGGHTFRGAIYTDMIDLQDKMFLFNFAMSAVQDAESFRAESESALGNVADGPSVPVPTQQPDGNRAVRRQRPPRRRQQ